MDDLDRFKVGAPRVTKEDGRVVVEWPNAFRLLLDTEDALALAAKMTEAANG